jgi:2-pyrone-4,6-dicarboxylate lactonase
MTRPCLPPRPLGEAPQFTPPPGACDCHNHTFGPYDRFPLAEDRSYTPAQFDGAAYLAHLDELGLTRGVLVTGSASGTDNGSILAAIAQAPGRLRGVAVPDPEVTDAELARWHAGGIRGVRANLFRIDGKAVYRNGVGLDVLQKLAPRIRDMGWHAQIWVYAPDLPALDADLRALGLPLVIDHVGRVPIDRGVSDPGFQHLCRMLAEGVAWTKISGADRNTRAGPPYLDYDPFVQAVLAANPERIVWGSDWPHINYFEDARMPDDAVLLNLLARWMPDTVLREQVLVRNPARLYDFG